MAVSRLFSVSLGPEIPAFLLMRKGNFASSIIASQLKLELSCQGAGRLQCWPKAGKGDGNVVRGFLEMSTKDRHPHMQSAREFIISRYHRAGAAHPIQRQKW